MKSFAPAKDAVKRGNNRALPRQKGMPKRGNNRALPRQEGNAAMDGFLHEMNA
jgi:hypothetical protein